MAKAQSKSAPFTFPTGPYLFRIVAASEVEAFMNEADRAGFLDVDWQPYGGESDGGDEWKGGARFLVWGTRPMDDECPTCGQPVDVPAEDATSELP